MNGEWERIWKEVVKVIFQDIIPAFTWRNWWKPQKYSVRIAGNLDEICTRYLLNTLKSAYSVPCPLLPLHRGFENDILCKRWHDITTTSTEATGTRLCQPQYRWTEDLPLLYSFWSLSSSYTHNLVTWNNCLTCTASVAHLLATSAACAFAMEA